MGNGRSQHRYSFQDQYDIIENTQPATRLYKLRSRQNRQLFTGRQLSCNDEHQTYQLQCIIHEKLTNPSPFVTKLLKSQSEIQDSYCSTENKFYLLYQMVPKVLADEISERSALGKPFLVEQIENVINRVAKGLKYLYDIYHHHNSVSSSSITWPTNPRQSIQLIDEWALPSGQGRQPKHMIYRPKDNQDVNQKMLSRAANLYSLGLVAKQMASIGSQQNITMQPGYNQLMNKIHILTSQQPSDRMVIYNMLSSNIRQSIASSQAVGNRFTFQQPHQYVSSNNMSIYPQNQRTQTKVTTKIQQPKTTSIYTAPPTFTKKFQSISQNKNILISNPSNQVYFNKSKDQTGFTKKQNIHIENVSTYPPNTRNASLSTSKANITINSKNIRNSSVGKIEPAIYPSATNSASYNIQAPQTSFTNTQRVPSLQVSSSKATFVTDSTNRSIPNKPVIQFNNRNSSSANYSSSFNQNLYANNSQSLSRQSSSFNFLNSQQTQPMMISSSIYEAKPVNTLAPVSSSGNFTTPSLSYQSSGPLTHGGLNYSFGKSPDQVFSFKATSLGQQGLFTPPEFYNKIKQSNQYKKSDPIEQNPISNYQPTTQSYQFSNSEQNNYQKYTNQQGLQTNTIKLSNQVVSSNESSNQMFANVSNIPITKSIQHPPPQIQDVYGKIAASHNAYQDPKTFYPVNEVFEKVATFQQAYQAPNIVINQTNNSRDDYVKQTPGKNNKSNQPFSTIPEVSQRSASARSEQERDYVIQQYQNGSRYQGFKSNGMRNGKGKFFYQEGSFYDGQWKNNNMHGYGKLYYSNNKLAYQGQWFIDQFHGKGKVFNDQPVPIFGYFDYTNFDNLQQKWKYYQGDLVCDSKQGEGKLVLSNDQFYQGQFRNDKVDGKGKFVNKNGEVIQGIWSDSRLVMKL